MNRRYPSRPLVGVGAIIFRENRVLLVRRGREPAYGKWSFPGGLVELGESLEEAVWREVREEVGLEVGVGELVVVLDRVIRDEDGCIEYHYVLLDFLCTSDVGDPKPASDVLDCTFVSPHELGAYTMTEGTVEVIERARVLKEGGRVVTYDASL